MARRTAGGVRARNLAPLIAVLALLLVHPTPTSAQGQFLKRVFGSWAKWGTGRVGAGFRSAPGDTSSFGILGDNTLTVNSILNTVDQWTEPLINGGIGLGIARDGANWDPLRGGLFRDSNSRPVGGAAFGNIGGGLGVGRGGGPGGGVFGRGGRGGRGGGSGGFDPNELKELTEPATGEQFQSYLDAVADNIEAASITAAVLNLASGIVYTVSGALGTASVGLSLTTAIPVFFFGLFNLEVQAITFLEGLRSDYQGTFTAELISVLGRVDALRQRIRNGTLVTDLEASANRLAEVRTLLQGLRTGSPLGGAFASAAGAGGGAGGGGAGGGGGEGAGAGASFRTGGEGAGGLSGNAIGGLGGAGSVGAAGGGIAGGTVAGTVTDVSQTAGVTGAASSSG
ncbi:hypothetical protein GPECTOR_30g212 [Gonium pectorale]|uniref:ABC transmembrane type-1 domain-containing protein n=1 Tax=Gonium pectorale TaxID=33097 RepID=A0A150GE52_GONPE|nr:hypothetical protein GPECTOR_30g212 [Gonium pectorale]|eukprot:KXZ48116.1 hypothetical protein GPECTOR_30g212 [Gonium pectorale]